MTKSVRTTWTPASRVAAMLAAQCLVMAHCPGALAAAEQGSGFALQVSPTRLEVPPGSAGADKTFEVANKGGKPFVVTTELSDFTAAEDGALKFVPDAPYAAAAWATVSPAKFEVKAGQTRKIRLRLAMPAEPEPGDHQFAVIFKVPAGRNSANIRVNRGIAAPVFVTTPGPVDATVRLAGLSAPGFVTGGPVKVTARIEDVGTVHRDFRGLGRLGVKAGGSTTTFPDFTVPRGSVREVSTSWNPPLMCRCDATVTLPGPSGEPVSASVRIVVFPVQLFGALLAGIAVLLLGAFFIRHRYRRRVIAAADQLAREQRT